MSNLSASLLEANDIEVSRENIKEISDDILFKKLRLYNLNPGPIMPSTRALYEKKLLNFLENGINQTVLDDTTSMSDMDRNVPKVESIRPDEADFGKSGNDSFDSYTRQISSIRSRAPLHGDRDLSESLSAQRDIRMKAKPRGSANLFYAVFAFVLVIIMFYVYLSRF